ncbi:MAG: GNAT family N-acetyltransferase, partial [Bacteroidota bacterium]
MKPSLPLYVLCRLYVGTALLLLPVLSGCTGKFGKLSMQEPSSTANKLKRALTKEQQKALETCLATPAPSSGVSEAAQTYLNTLGGVRPIRTACKNYVSRFGEPTVTLKKDEKTHAATAIIKTQRLSIASATEADTKDYEGLFGDEKVMAKYANGKVKSPEYTERRVKTWVERWNDGIPFSGLAVRKHDDTFLGHVVIGGAEKQDGINSSEEAIMIVADQWNQGYGTEITGA